MSLNFQAIRNDTFDEVPFELKKNSTVINLTGATIRMQLRKVAGGVIAFAPSLTITNATNGLFKINKQIIDVESFNYLYDIEIAFADGTVKTWISGEFLIKNDITR